MEQKSTVDAPVATRRRAPLFLIGALLFFAGPIGYIVQLQLGYLKTPWYVPILATIGLLLMLKWVWQTRGILRIAAALPFALLYVFMWVALSGLTTPTYRGPLQTPRLVPKFSTTMLGGKKFTEKDLQTGEPSLLVFFRGRW